MKQTLILKNFPMNLNEYRNAHYHLVNQEKHQWEAYVAFECKAQKLEAMQTANIHFEFWFKDRRRHDPDNYAACAKFILDGIVKAGILKDDSFQYIPEFKVTQGGLSKQPYINITMEDNDD